MNILLVYYSDVLQKGIKVIALHEYVNDFERVH